MCTPNTLEFEPNSSLLQNGFWFSLGFCGLFFIPVIVLSVFTSTCYTRRRQETNNNSSTVFLDDPYSDYLMDDSWVTEYVFTCPRVHTYIGCVASTNVAGWIRACACGPQTDCYTMHSSQRVLETLCRLCTTFYRRWTCVHAAREDMALASMHRCTRVCHWPVLYVHMLSRIVGGNPPFEILATPPYMYIIYL